MAFWNDSVEDWPLQVDGVMKEMVEEEIELMRDEGFSFFEVIEEEPGYVTVIGRRRNHENS